MPTVHAPKGGGSGDPGDAGRSGIDYTDWLDRISKRFTEDPKYLIPILQYVQGEAGYLPPEAMRAVARYLRIAESKVFGVASFYAQFHFEPRGLNKVTVCRGTACHVRGSGRLLRDLEGQLGVPAGGTTPDMLCTLETVACFGACALAPVVVVNGRVHGRQSSASVRKLVGGVRTGSSKARAARRRN